MLANNTQKLIQLSAGDFRLDTSRNRITVEKKEIELPAKAIKVLFHLMSNAQKTVMREELIQVVWDGNEFVGEKALTHAIWQLRKALNEPMSEPIYIETIPKLGYRFLLPVKKKSDHKQINPYTNISTLWRNIFLGTLTVATGIIFLLIDKLWFQKNEVANSPITDTFALQSELTMLTSYPGIERSPDISKDGNQLVFEWQKKGLNSDIYTLDLTQQQPSPIQLTDTPYQEKSPVFSPDGLRVAFIRLVGESGCSVFIRSLTTDEEYLIDKCSGGYLFSLSWSPNGEYLAYSYFQQEDQTSGIVTYHLPSRQRQFISNRKVSSYFVDTAPCWSPDSKVIAYSKLTNPTQFNLEVVSLDKKSVISLPVLGETTGCSFDVTGKNILFSNNDSGNIGLFSLNIKSGKIQQVKSNINRNVRLRGVKVSAELNAIFFSTLKTEVQLSTISLLPKQSKSVNTEPLIQSIGEDYNGQYSQDGSSILFNSTRDGKHGTWISDSDGSKNRRIEAIPNSLGSPSWSPKGDKVALVGKASGSNIDQIFIYDFVSNQTHQLSNNNFNHGPPTWSIDGKAILAGRRNNGKWGIWRYPIDGIPAKQITNKGDLFAQELPDGQSMITVRSGKNGLWRYTYHSDTYELFPITITDANWASWQLFEQQIYYIESEGDTVELKKISLNDKSISVVSTVTNFSNKPWSRISVFDNSKFLVSNRVVNEEDIGMMLFR